MTLCSFFRYCQVNFAKASLPNRPEDDMLRAPRQTIVRTNTLPNGQTHQEDVELITEFSWRNFFSTINFAKIMQKLSKNRSHRIWMLVQYKSSVKLKLKPANVDHVKLTRMQAVLKRVLRVSHPMLQLHVLKLIKSQVPFCGRKWRQCGQLLLAD